MGRQQGIHRRSDREVGTFSWSKYPGPTMSTMRRYNAIIQEAAKLKTAANGPPIELYTIGLGISDTDSDSNVLREVLRRAADQKNAQMTLQEYKIAAGNVDTTSHGTEGRAFFTTDATELAAALAVIVKRTTSGLLSFTAPTVASIRMTDRNYLYKGSFSPFSHRRRFGRGA